MLVAVVTRGFGRIALSAVVSMREREALLADARAAEQRILRGEARPLEGIPLGVKDLEYAEGLPNTGGSLIFKDRIAERDEAQVARLKAAGAIVVGKTNAPEFGHTAITKKSRVRDDALAVESRGHAGRLVGRIGGGARRLRAAACYCE